MERIYPRLSQRNIEAEVLSELERSLSKHDSTSVHDKHSSAPSEELKHNQTSTSYSRNFGTFDVTICNADDGTQIVLILLEGRVALNGKPIYFKWDDEDRRPYVVDWCGNVDPLLQRYYDQAIKVRAERQRDESGPDEGAIVDRRNFIDTMRKLRNANQDIINAATNLQKSSRPRQRASLIQRLLPRSSLFRRFPKAAMTDSSNLSSVISELHNSEFRVAEIFSSLLKQNNSLDLDKDALIWTVRTFCQETILRESEKFVQERYFDLYNKYTQAIAREAQLVEELKLERNVMNHNEDDENSGNNSSDRNINITEYKRLKSLHKDMENSERVQHDSSTIEKLKAKLGEKKMIISKLRKNVLKLKKNVDRGLKVQNNLQQANRLAHRQIDHLQTELLRRTVDNLTKRQQDEFSKEKSEILKTLQILKEGHAVVERH